jgi:hypothetical protein
MSWKKNLSMAIMDKSTELHRRFFAPLWPCLEASPRQRQCQEYSDKDFLEVGMSRVVIDCQSGRDLLQRLALMRRNHGHPLKRGIDKEFEWVSAIFPTPTHLRYAQINRL